MERMIEDYEAELKEARRHMEERRETEDSEKEE
jgi:hypothetical protein